VREEGRKEGRKEGRPSTSYVSSIVLDTCMSEREGKT
jgi:hypothetical protein